MPKCLSALYVRWLEIEVALAIQLFLSDLVGFFFCDCFLSFSFAYDKL